MEIYKNIDECLTEISDGKIVVRAGFPMLPLLCMVLGVSLALLASFYEPLKTASAWQLGLYFFSVVFLVVGAFRFFSREKSYCYSPTNEEVRRVSLFFNGEDAHKMQKICEEGRFGELVGSYSDHDSAFRLIVYGTELGGVYFFQMAKYEPFDYFPLSQPLSCEGAAAESLRQLLQSIK